jgi:flagellar L-ring protein precursor FlgH
MKKIILLLTIVLINSVFSESQNMHFLFSDTKASKKGDIIKIIILERTSANEKVNTSTGKEYNTKGEITTLPLGGISKEKLPAWQWKHDEGYSGKGELKRENYITGVIPGKIVDITDEGNYKIEGEKSIDVNGSKQIIKISGYVRPQDISEDNTVYSNLIFDMKLSLIGKGFIEEKRKPGLLTRIFSIFKIF